MTQQQYFTLKVKGRRWQGRSHGFTAIKRGPYSNATTGWFFRAGASVTGISRHIRTTGHEGINADTSSPARKSTVVVVDPHQVIRLGIKALLSVEANFR